MMALPSLRTWQYLADFKYPESSVEYQAPIIKISDLSGTPSNLLKIYYPINFRGGEEIIFLVIDSAAKYSPFLSASIK